MQLTKKHIFEGGYIALPIDLPEDLPRVIIFEGENYYLKEEFHISLVCVKRLREITNGLDPEIAEGKLIHLFKEFTDSNSVDKFTLTNELRHVIKDDRKTIISMAYVDGLQELFEFINDRLGVSFATQPAHVTLYTLQPNKGIGLLNEKELNNLSTKAAVSELSANLKSCENKIQ